jgi:hypothetical protein
MEWDEIRNILSDGAKLQSNRYILPRSGDAANEGFSRFVGVGAISISCKSSKVIAVDKMKLMSV